MTPGQATAYAFLMTDSAVHFDAVLHPHRSLSRKAFLIVMILVGAISFAGGMVFLILGAWPVFGFFGLDALLVYTAFRVNFRDGRRYERVRLGNDTLEVLQIAPGGAETRASFQPYWTRVLIDATINLDFLPEESYQGDRYPKMVRPDPIDMDLVEKRWEEYGFKRKK